MSAAHTPGPWAVCEHSWCETSISAPGFDHAVCSLDINHATEESQAADKAVMAANARLIAAAPELLAYALCEEARTRGEDIAETVLRRHGFDPRNGTAAAFMDSMRRAAIAMATGGAQ